MPSAPEDTRFPVGEFPDQGWCSCLFHGFPQRFNGKGGLAERIFSVPLLKAVIAIAPNGI